METKFFISRRRTPVKHGMVNFPMESTSYLDTKQGGMFVKLVIVDTSEYEVSNWKICVGGDVVDQFNAELVGDDMHPHPNFNLDTISSDDSEGEVAYTHKQCEQKYAEWEANLERWNANFSATGFEDEELAAKYSQSPRISLIASFVIGITGWSGDNGKQSWSCSYASLTEEGKALYDTMKASYPDCKLHLLTFLDT